MTPKDDDGENGARRGMVDCIFAVHRKTRGTKERRFLELKKFCLQDWRKPWGK
jgi:hypothetical protein